MLHTILYTVHYPILCTVYAELYTLSSTLADYSILDSLYLLLYTALSTHCSRLLALSPLHSLLLTLSTLDPLPSPLHSRLSTLDSRSTQP